MSRIRTSARVVAALLALLPAMLAGQGWIEPVRPTPLRRIEKLRSAIHVVVTARVARVTVEEWFRNGGALLDEASYLYPLPGEASFSDFSLWQGDQELKGEMMDATQARSIYENIVRLKRDPALIELVGHGVLRARVFPINPGETRKITLRYTQLLERAGDAWRFRFASGPVAAPKSFRMELDSAARIGTPYSPTHHVTTSRRGDHLEITLADSTWSGDLDLLLPLTRGLVGTSVLTHQLGSDDGYFMLLMAPGVATERQMHRDLVAVLDVSGSMSGEKIEQGKAALRQLLGTLREGDRFRLIAFSSDVRRESSGWMDASGENLRTATEWVRALAPGGGTNIAGAIAEALSAQPAEGALGIVVFLTDGLPTQGDTDPERIADQAERSRGAFRVFSFGIGYDVNTYLLDRLAERGRGASDYIQPGGDIEQAVGRLATKVASPVLTDLALTARGAEIYDLQPGSVPDLFAGDELVVFGRYRNPTRGSWDVTLVGRRGAREERFGTTVPPAGEGSSDYIAHLWAARKAGALTREIRLHGQTTETMNELKELALRYGILTDYTAYLVQEPGIVAVRPPVPAPEPMRQSGAPAVAQARRDAFAANAAVASDVTGATGLVAEGAAGVEVRHVGGRAFVQRDSTWTDLAHHDSQRVVTVEPFSRAYFTLLEALPELRKPAALDPAVLVAGRHVSIKIGAGGRTAWDPGELERIVGEFRS